MEQIKLTQNIKLEQLLKDHWQPVGTWGESSLMMGKYGERMIYDMKREEIVIKYRTDLK